MKDLVDDRVLESGFSNKKREQNFSNFDFSLFEGNFEHVNRLVNSREYMEKLVNFSKTIVIILKLMTMDYSFMVKAVQVRHILLQQW